MTREEAINEIKSWDFLEGKKIDVIHTLIPELKESEDERIKKTIRQLLETARDAHSNTSLAKPFIDALAWLEKQKEQKPVDYEAELKKCKDNPLYFFDKYVTIKQKPMEWSEEDETAFGDLMWCIKQAAKSAKDENDMGNIWFAENWVKNRLKSLRPQPKLEWNEEDDKMCNSILNELTLHLVYDGTYTGTTLGKKYKYGSEIRWIKSLPERFNLQPKEEQSEYDENMDKECIKLCNTLNSIPSIDTFESCCGHLKDRYSVWFFCNDVIAISRLGRSVERNYSDGKWELVVDSTDTHPTGVFWLRSKVPFQSYDEMEESVNELCVGIQYWFNTKFDSYFNDDVCK